VRLGFRTWILLDDGDDFHFESIAIQNSEWKLVGSNQAREGRGKRYGEDYARPIPGKNTVGFYHYYDAVKAQSEYVSRGLLGACMCWGEMAGKDVEGMFRSEYAQILAVTEPDWEQFNKPPRPAMPQTLAQNLWMVAVNRERQAVLGTPESVRSYITTLARVVGISPEQLQTEELQVRFDKVRATAEADYARYEKAVADWEETIRTWVVGRSRRFREKMPFPVYSKVSELVDYARHFGELGPPDRSRTSASSSSPPAWWGSLE